MVSFSLPVVAHPDKPSAELENGIQSTEKTFKGLLSILDQYL
jgi:hypothetical protein